MELLDATEEEWAGRRWGLLDHVDVGEKCVKGGDNARLGDTLDDDPEVRLDEEGLAPGTEFEGRPDGPDIAEGFESLAGGTATDFEGVDAILSANRGLGSEDQPVNLGRRFGQTEAIGELH